MKFKDLIVTTISTAHLLLAGCNVGVSSGTDAGGICGINGYCENGLLFECRNPNYEQVPGTICPENPGTGFCCSPKQRDGGTLDGQMPCYTACDCIGGEFCADGICKPPDSTTWKVYCCDRPCPIKNQCEYTNGAFDNCKGLPIHDAGN